MPHRQQEWGFRLSTRTSQATKMIAAFKHFESWAMVNQQFSCTSTFISKKSLIKMLLALSEEDADGFKVSIGMNENIDRDTGKTNFRSLELIMQPITFTSDDPNDFSHEESTFIYWTNDSVLDEHGNIITEVTEPPVIKNPPFGES